MDSMQAYEKAKELWGRNAFANDSLRPGTCYVGVVTPSKGKSWDVRGQGESFESAFENAASDNPNTTHPFDEAPKLA